MVGPLDARGAPARVHAPGRLGMPPAHLGLSLIHIYLTIGPDSPTWTGTYGWVHPGESDPAWPVPGDETVAELPLSALPLPADDAVPAEDAAPVSDPAPESTEPEPEPEAQPCLLYTSTAQTLVNRAVDRGGRDNVTVVVVELADLSLIHI